MTFNYCNIKRCQVVFGDPEDQKKQYFNKKIEDVMRNSSPEVRQMIEKRQGKIPEAKNFKKRNMNFTLKMIEKINPKVGLAFSNV